MNTLKYKGYIGSVDYSEPDKVFFGKIEGIDGLVNYEGESVSELTAAFHEAVEDYLAFCDDHGVKPEKSYSGTFNVRIAPMTHREIANRAAEAGITINAFVKKALDKAVKDTAPDPVYALHQPKSEDEAMHSMTICVPGKDLEFARELAKKMKWIVID